MAAVSRAGESTDTAVILAEYNALRQEILKRLEIRYQILNIVLVAAGAMLAVGTQPEVPPSLLLIFPLFSLALFASWLRNSSGVRLMRKYIRDEIESRVPGLHAETYMSMKQAKRSPFRLSSDLSSTSVFVGTQVVTIAAAWVRSPDWTANYLLFVLAGVCLLIACFMAAKECVAAIRERPSLAADSKVETKASALPDHSVAAGE
jgi:hypothetical protein